MKRSKTHAVGGPVVNKEWKWEFRMIGDIMFKVVPSKVKQIKRKESYTKAKQTKLLKSKIGENI